MTRDETKKIIGIMMVTWPNYKPELSSDFVDIYHEMIRDLDARETMAALKVYAQQDTSGFAPSVGQLRAKLVEMKSEQEISEGEAWGMVRKAISRSAYYADEEFRKLPKILQKAVGSPETLKTWAIMDEEELDFARNQLRQALRTEQARQKERSQLSPDLLAIMDGRPKPQIRTEAPKELPEPYQSEESRISAAEKARKRLEAMR